MFQLRVIFMRHAPSTLVFSFAHRPAAATGGIEWEELPSLVSRVRPSADHDRVAAWDATRPAEFDTSPASLPFRELQGVAVREVREPDVFRHFFGR